MARAAAVIRTEHSGAAGKISLQPEGSQPSLRAPAEQRPRTDARVVDRARLESVCTLIGTEGSNPSLSATFNKWLIINDLMLIRPARWRASKNTGKKISLITDDDPSPTLAR